MEERGRKRKTTGAEIAFSREWTLYVSILPFRAPTVHHNKMTWFCLWRGLQSPTASGPFSSAGEATRPCCAFAAVTHGQERRSGISQNRYQTRWRHGQKPWRVAWKAVGNQEVLRSVLLSRTANVVY